VKQSSKFVADVSHISANKQTELEARSMFWFKIAKFRPGFSENP